VAWNPVHSQGSRVERNEVWLADPVNASVILVPIGWVSLLTSGSGFRQPALRE